MRATSLKKLLAWQAGTHQADLSRAALSQEGQWQPETAAVHVPKLLEGQFWQHTHKAKGLEKGQKQV